MTELINEHYRNPRNVGTLADGPNIGTALVGSPRCGEVMRLQIQVDPGSGVIDDVRVKIFGSGEAIASGSLCSMWIKGKSIAEALAIRNVAIAEALALPADKFHCTVLAEEAIRLAVDDYYRKNGIDEVIE